MTKEQRKELLEKQLALLSELSQKADPSVEMTFIQAEDT